MKDKFYDNASKMIEIIENSQNDENGEMKRGGLFLDWLHKHSEFFQTETRPMNIPHSCIPNKITAYAYNKCSPKLQQTLDKYYTKNENDYVKNDKNFDGNDLNALLHGIVFIRGNVVWVDFGFNVGREFGGRHPAIILKNLGEVLTVAPLTSGNPKAQKCTEVIIDRVYNLPQRDRYTNVTRITPVSCYRVDLNSPIGSIHSKKMKEIFSAIKMDWGF